MPLALHDLAPASEYNVLHGGALLVDRSDRRRWRFTGPQARTALTGLVTNDVVALAPGHGCYAAALTAKGKIIADTRILARPDGVLVDVPGPAGEGWTKVVTKFMNPRITPYRDISGELLDLGIFGTRAAHVVSRAFSLSSEVLMGLPLYAQLEASSEGTSALIVRVPDGGVEGFDVLVAPESCSLVTERLLSAGAVVGSAATLEIARIEAGRPAWGLDMDESTIPQEANLDELAAISYTKGCYTGQETVARIHFRGHVNRHLRGLRIAGEVAPALHALLLEGEGKPVGDVRSSVRSPRFGLIALGMVRREVPIGATLIARWEHQDPESAPPNETMATVAELPFA